MTRECAYHLSSCHLVTLSFSADPHPHGAFGCLEGSTSRHVEHIDPIFGAVGDPAAVGRPGAEREGVGVEIVLQLGEGPTWLEGCKIAPGSARRVHDMPGQRRAICI